MKKTISMALAIGLLTASTSIAAATTNPDTTKMSLAGVPAAELPAKASAIIKAAKSRERTSVTVDVVKTALSIHPTIAPTLVGAIGKTAPEVVDVAAGTAAAEQPKLAAEITKAATAAAPKKAGKIVAAVCRSVPSEYRRIALAAAQAAPDQSKDILHGVVAALPQLKSGIEAALASYGSNPSVGAVLDASTVATTANASGIVQPVRGPTISPPYVPLSGSTTGTGPADSGPVPAGGRDYAAP
jgi:hypothetical protein